MLMQVQPKNEKCIAGCRRVLPNIYSHILYNCNVYGIFVFYSLSTYVNHSQSLFKPLAWYIILFKNHSSYCRDYCVWIKTSPYKFGKRKMLSRNSGPVAKTQPSHCTMNLCRSRPHLTTSVIHPFMTKTNRWWRQKHL